MTATSHKISTAGTRGGRPLVEAAAVLRVSDLRTPWGWIYSHELAAPGGGVVKLRLDPGAVVWVYAEHWPAGSRWSTCSYSLSLISAPQPLGGLRWRFVCPHGGGRCSALYLPSGSDVLASRRAHGLAFASQRQRAPDRAASRAARIRADLGGDGLTRPRAMRAATFTRLSAELARLDGIAAAGIPKRDGLADAV